MKRNCTGTLTGFVFLLASMLISQWCLGSENNGRRVVVLNFSPGNVDTVFHYLKKELPLSLENELKKSEELYPVGRDSGLTILNEIQYDFDTGFLDSTTTCKLLDSTGAEMAVFGKLSQIGKKIRVDAKLLEIETNITISQSQVVLVGDSSGVQLDSAITVMSRCFLQDLIERYSPLGFPFSEDELGILLTSFQPPVTNSVGETEALSFITKVKTVLKREVEKSNLYRVRIKSISKEQLKKGFDGSSYITSHEDAERLGSEVKANLVLWGSMVKSSSSDTVYFNPRITVIDTLMATPYDKVDQSCLEAVTGQLKKSSLPRQSIYDSSNLTRFLLAYVFFKNKQYDGTIRLLEKIIESMETENELIGVIYFSLADAYLFRGKVNKNNMSRAKADWEKALQYYQKSLDKIQYYDDQECLIWIYNNMGIAHQLNGDLSQALELFQRSLAVKEKIGNDASMVRIYNNIGNVYLFKGQWNKALEIYLKSVAIMEKSGNARNLCIAYDNMGIIYQLILQRDRALELYQKSLDIKRQLGDESGIAQSFNYIGRLYQEKGEFDKALKFLQDELEINQRLHNEPRLARTYCDLGLVHQKKGELDKAFEYYQKSSRLMEMMDDKAGMVQTYNYMANVYQKQKNWEQALALYEKSLKLMEAKDDESALARIYDRMGDVYNSMDHFAKALEYYEKAAKLLKKNENMESLTLVMYTMGLIYLKQEKYTRGYEMMKQAIEMEEQYGYKNLQGEKAFLKKLEVLINKTDK